MKGLPELLKALNDIKELPTPEQASLLREIRGEHKHSGHEVVMLNAGNACPICLAGQVASMRASFEHIIHIIDTWEKQGHALNELSRIRNIAKNAIS